MKECSSPTCSKRIDDKYTYCYQHHVRGNDLNDNSWFTENLQRGERFVK